MVNTCCVPGCNSGYKSCKNVEKPALYRFPKDSSLRDKWVAAIPRKDWTVCEYHRVCGKDFYKEDFSTVSTDEKVKRRTMREDQ